jgi:selenocysteine lyase/cysteine desulfurase
MPGLWGYHAALSTLAEFGADAIESRLAMLTDLLLRELQAIPDVHVVTPPDPRQRAGIVTIALKGHYNAESVFKDLLKHSITAAPRQGMIRFSPHFYMNEEEIISIAGRTREFLTKGAA